MDIRKYLEDLENRLDEQQEERLLADYYRFADRQMKDVSYFKPERVPAPSLVEWEPVFFNDTFEDYDMMLYKQLLRANPERSIWNGIRS